MVTVSYHTKKISMIFLMYIRFNGDTPLKQRHGKENENTMKKILTFILWLQVLKMVGGCHCCATIVIC